jgi:hypothetical protein
MDKRKLNGGHSTKATRPDDKRLMTKSEMQDTYERLKPFLPEAILQLEAAMQAGEKWAIELWFKYFFGMPKQTIDQHISIEKPIFNSLDLDVPENNGTE